MARRKTLEIWIQEAMLDGVPDQTGPISQIVLCHMVGQQRQELHTAKLNKGGKVPTPKELCELLRGKAEAFAQDLPGVQTFQLMAFYTGSQEPTAFQPFMIGQNQDPATMGLMTEAPDEKGQTQQRMRWNDGFLSQIFQRQAVMDNHSMAMITKMGDMIEKLTDDNHQAFDIVKEMIMEKVANDREHEMKVMQYQRSTAERAKWLSFAPALVNTVLGKEVFPQSSEDTALVESIADTLTGEQLMQIGSVLKPEVMGPLAARMVKYQEKKAREAALAEQAVKQLSPHPNPEADAGGD